MSLALGALVNLGRNTITGMLCTTGQQFKDWSAACRLFSTLRFDPEKLFAVARRTIAERLDREVPFVASIDDTHLRKTGKKVHVFKYRQGRVEVFAQPLGHVRYARTDFITMPPIGHVPF